MIGPRPTEIDAIQIGRVAITQTQHRNPVNPHGGIPAIQFAAHLRETVRGDDPITEPLPFFLIAGDPLGQLEADITQMNQLGNLRRLIQGGRATVADFSEMHALFQMRVATGRATLQDPGGQCPTGLKIVGAEVQIVTYDEFLPALLGAYNLPVYSGYDDTIDPTIANAFSTAAYRVGHTMLNESLLRIQADWTEAPEGHLTLAQAFFQPGQIVNHNIDTLLRGMVFQVANTIDNFVINDVRNMLFMNFNGPVPLDLMSLNINRGREHGLPDFNTLRTDYGLPAYTTFSQINPDPAQVAKLSAAYSSINDMDAWVGLLTEVHLPDSAVGETLAAVIGDQFYRLREGDRFFYLNDPFFLDHATLTRELENTRLSDIIARNTSIDRMTIPDNAFFVCTLEGDADRSGLVSINDLNLVLANWGDNTMPFLPAS